VELLTIATMAHNSPVQLITVAAVVATVTAVGGLAMAARAKHEESVRVRGTEYLPAAS
jgi:hypothetical protein